MISIFDIFTIGIGPSSSHTIGPIVAANMFLKKNKHLLSKVATVRVDLYGSLSYTGRGHGTVKAIVWGLMGLHQDQINPKKDVVLLEEIQKNGILLLDGKYPVRFHMDKNVVFKKRRLVYHPNGLVFVLLDANKNVLASNTYYSVGGGFVVDDDEKDKIKIGFNNVPYNFDNAKELNDLSIKHQKSIADIVRANEESHISAQTISNRLKKILHVIQKAVEEGLHTHSILPGGLDLKRRAPTHYLYYQKHPNDVWNMLNMYALAASEQNAAGERVVTSPTNGASGVIPGVLMTYLQLYKNITKKDIEDFFLTAGAMAILYKRNASISGAAVGCQGEIGTACSMAAAALTHMLGGNTNQVLTAAEIGIEHNLGLVCDPIMGLVQVPCIERNAMASVEACNAMRLALIRVSHNRVSLDNAIKAMNEIGKDMKAKYRETSKGGLAYYVTYDSGNET